MIYNSILNKFRINISNFIIFRSFFKINFFFEYCFKVSRLTIIALIKIIFVSKNENVWSLTLLNFDIHGIIFNKKISFWKIIALIEIKRNSKNENVSSLIFWLLLIDENLFDLKVSRWKTIALLEIKRVLKNQNVQSFVCLNFLNDEYNMFDSFFFRKYF